MLILMYKQINSKLSQAATDEETRKKMLIIILAPILSLLLITTMFFYILTHPLDFLEQFFSGNSITAVEQLQNDFGMYQSVLKTDPHYIDN